MSTTAHINPALLVWSRMRAGLSRHAVAKGLAAKPEQVTAWETGDRLPTFRQAQHWATVTHVPFGFLFLPNPPEESLPLPDLRTVGSETPARLSADLLDTLRGVLQKQAWYLDYLKDQERTPLPFVGRYSTATSPTEVADDIRRELAVAVESDQSSGKDYFQGLVMASERIGILVMRSGIVGNNTHRKLDVAEFRGFAISNPLAPLVFINAADVPAARLFTLLHEIAHIWVGSSGISDALPGSPRREEVFCNAVAGEFLVPQSVFGGCWREVADWRANLPIPAARFHVSPLVIARRALDLGYIDQDDYQRYYRDELEVFRRKEKSGGSFYRNVGAKNSLCFSRAVVSEALSGRLLLRDAGRLLGVPPGKVRSYAETLNK